MLRINLFGPGQAYYNDQLLTGFPNQQCYLLFCYLLLGRQRTHYREQVGAVFWGDYPTSTSRKYLRNALWQLRQAFITMEAPVNDFLLVDGQEIGFVMGNHCWLDIDIFERCSTRYQNLLGPQLSGEQAAEIEQATNLYTGDLLEGLYEDWCLHERERLLLLYLSNLNKLLTFYDYNGTYEQALLYGEQILQQDETREQVHRQMMQLYWKLGDRNAALGQYKRCAKILHETMGITPMAETEALYQKMKTNQFSPAPTHPATAQSNQALMQHVVNRIERLEETIIQANQELRELRQLLKNMGQ